MYDSIAAARKDGWELVFSAFPTKYRYYSKDGRQKREDDLVNQTPEMSEVDSPPMTIKLNIRQFDCNENGVLCAEISTLHCAPPNKNTTIHLEENGRIRTFNFTKTDTDTSEEDICGWNFTDPNTGQKLLIIND